MFKLLPLILSNVIRNKRRSLLTLISTSISLCLLALLLALYAAFFLADDISPASARRLIVRHKVSLTQSLPVYYGQRIQSVGGVERVTPWQWFGGTYKEPKNFFARIAVDPDAYFQVCPDFTVKPEEAAAFRRSPTACACTRNLAKKFNWKLGERITIVGDIFPVNLDLTLRCIFDAPQDDEELIFSRAYVRELLGASSSSRDQVGTFTILAKSPDDVPLIGRTVDAMFANSPFPTKTESEKEFGRSFLAFLGNIKLFISAICAAVTFTILLVSANTVAMSVRERTREVAILRTVGFTPAEIMLLIIGESMALSVIGGIFGVAMAIGLGKAGSQGGLNLAIGPGIAALTIGMAAVVGAISAIVPGVIASRTNLVQGLRFAG
jgi:putative ABC transport system permease protein